MHNVAVVDAQRDGPTRPSRHSTTQPCRTVLLTAIERHTAAADRWYPALSVVCSTVFYRAVVTGWTPHAPGITMTTLFTWPPGLVSGRPAQHDIEDTEERDPGSSRGRRGERTAELRARRLVLAVATSYRMMSEAVALVLRREPYRTRSSRLAWIKATAVRRRTMTDPLSVKIIGPLSPKALKCKKFGWPLSIIGLICKNDVGSNVLVQVYTGTSVVISSV